MAEDPFQTEATGYEPTRRGRYVFRRPLASGGLGVVSIFYDEQLNREVALKEIRGDCADDSRHQTNFCAEAEVTGLLEHPGVVPIYSMGTNEQGRPFYAMRLISGRELRDDIVRFHEDSKTSKEKFRGPKFRQLVQRLIDVCNVIHYAHSRGVLHRDLKSVNVMLGRYGETLVIDWGLAKTTGESAVDTLRTTPEDPLADSGVDPAESERPLSVSHQNLRHTLAGSAMGTISYAPPEQLEGRTDDIDARSDIYSIGAMLYEVLVGQPPQKGMNLTEAIKAIEARRIPAPVKVIGSVPRPLSAIACQAMSPAREHRYQTAKELRKDLQAWLDDQPVSAYSESRLERLNRWKRKHQTFVRLAIVSLGMVAVVSLFALYRIDAARKLERLAHAETVKAREEATSLFKLAREATDNLLTRTSDRLLEIPDATEVRQDLLDDAVESYEQMAKVRSNDPELRRELVRVAMGLSEVQLKLERREEAIESLRSARSGIESLDETEDRVLMARTLIQESRVQGASNPEPAEDAISQAIEITRNLRSESIQGQLAHGEALIQRGNVASDLGDELRAIESFESAANTLRALLDRQLGPSLQHDIRLQLTRAYSNQAMMRPTDATNDPLIRAGYASALVQATWLTERFPHDPQVAIEHAQAASNYGEYLLDVADLSAAESFFQQSADDFEELASKKPSVPVFKERLVLAWVGLGNVASDRGDAETAIERYAVASDFADQLLTLNRNRRSYLNTAAQAKAMHADATMDTDPELSQVLLREAHDLLPPKGDSHMRDYVESTELKLYQRQLDPTTIDGLASRLAQYVQSTAALTSVLARFNSACVISECCELVADESDNDSQLDAFLDVALERLGSAIDETPENWAEASTTAELGYLRETRPDAFESIRPQP